MLLTHEDIELAADAVADLAEQPLPLVPLGEVADRAGNAESPGLPLLDALAELLRLPGACVHGRPQRRQLLHYRTPTRLERNRARFRGFASAGRN